MIQIDGKINMLHIHIIGPNERAFVNKKAKAHKTVINKKSKSS